MYIVFVEVDGVEQRHVINAMSRNAAAVAGRRLGRVVSVCVA